MSNDYLSLDIHMDDDLHVAIVGNAAFSTQGKIYLEVKNACDLEKLQSELESLAFAIREFRMKNFPETTEIE